MRAINERTLKLSVESNALWVFIKVMDTGEGIPEENLAHIFEPFFTTKPAGEGRGLGLDIVRKIIEKHQGKLFGFDFQEGLHLNSGLTHVADNSDILIDGFAIRIQGQIRNRIEYLNSRVFSSLFISHNLCIGSEIKIFILFSTLRNLVILPIINLS